MAATRMTERILVAFILVIPLMWHIIQKRGVLVQEKRALYIHCKNKPVVLTTEWLPWLQTRGRDSDHERFPLILKPYCIRQSATAAHFILQPQCTENPQNIRFCEGVIINAL